MPDVTNCTVYREWASEDQEGVPVLDKASFVNKIFDGQYQDFASSLFCSASKKNELYMDEGEFLTLGEHLCELSANSLQQQLEYYFNLFSTNGSISKNDMKKMLHTSCLMAYAHVGLNLAQTIEQDDPIFAAMINGLFGQTMETIEFADFKRWSNISCAGLIQGLHVYVLNGILRWSSRCEGGPADSEVASCIGDRSAFLSWTMLWAICSSLPQSSVYFPSGEVPSNTASPFNSSASQLPLESVLSHGGWQSLYSSNKDGLSVTRFKTKVFEYKGPSIMLLSFQDCAYCLALDEEWKESTQKLGGPQSSLIQLLPQYKHMQGGAPMVYFNLTNRLSPQNLSIGKTPQTTFIKVDCEFAKVNHYGIDFSLAAIEVWGCANKAVRKSQLEQQQWNEKQADKLKNRRLKIDKEEWKDSPDRQILDMGGVKTEHAER